MDVFLTSPWIPPEWIKAHGMEPRGIWSVLESCHQASALAAGTCAFAEAVLHFSKLHIAKNAPTARPAMIFATSCDQLRRTFDCASSQDHPNIFLFNIPATQTAAAKRIYKAELERLGQFLCALGGSHPTESRLQETLVAFERVRQQLLACAPVSHPKEFAESITQFHWDGTFHKPESAKAGARTSLALVGGPLLKTHWTVFDIVESAGGQITLNASETGERTLSTLYPNSGSALDALAEGYMTSRVDVFQRPNLPFYSWLTPRLRSRGIKGILLWHFTGCDLWRAELQTLRERCGLPVLLIEADEAQGCSARDVNRIEAFVETLQ